MNPIRTSALAVALTAAACTYDPPVVPLDARPADVERLAGRWTGGYDGETSGRSGSIEFILVAGQDHAHGDVVMIPLGAHHAYQSWREMGPVREADMSQELTIRFVAVDNGEITGELAPYRDPDCDCRALTRFRGRLRGDLIEGSFVTYTARAARPAHGTWKVGRKRP
jgi:hypothetical protein